EFPLYFYFWNFTEKNGIIFFVHFLFNSCALEKFCFLVLLIWDLVVLKDAELAQVMEGSIDYDPITPELYQRVSSIIHVKEEDVITISCSPMNSGYRCRLLRLLAGQFKIYFKPSRVAIVVASMCSQFCSPGTMSSYYAGYFSGDKKSQAQQQVTSRVPKNPKHNSLKLKSYSLAYQELIQVYFEATDVIINSIIVSQCSAKWTTTPVII
ncbi:hypothetical protein C5167_004026, partial [Papaver somniferum]